MSDLGSNNSLYKSAPASSSEGDFHDDDNGLDDDLQRPNFLPGSSESSLIQDERDVRSTLDSLRCKLNKVWNFGLHLGSNQKVDDHLDDDDDAGISWRNSSVRARIVGFETLEKEKKLTVYKLKIQHRGHWGVSQIPNWFLYRRYTDFAQMHQKMSRNFPDSVFQMPPKRWIGNNFDPVFIGQRIDGFNKFLKQILDSESVEIRDSSLVRDFLCLDAPPNRASSLSSCRIRRKESLEELTEGLREMLSQRDMEIESLRSESDQLRKQREALIKAFDGGHQDFHSFGLKPFPTSGLSSDISQTSSGLPAAAAATGVMTVHQQSEL